MSANSQKRTFGRRQETRGFSRTGYERQLISAQAAGGKSPRELLSDRAGLDRVLRHIRSVELALNTN